jgi:hypothetical protein
MKKRLSSISAVLLVLTSLQFGASGGLHKIWEIDLGAETRRAGERNGVRSGVLSVRFSPDGRKIAIASNPYRLGRPVMSRLFIVRVHNPQDERQQFDLTNIASDSEDMGVKPPAITWSPTGDRILAGFNLIHLNDGSSCELPAALAQTFLGADRVVAQVKHKSGPPVMEFFDSQCKSIGTWDIGYSEWSLADASTDRELVAVLRTNNASSTPFGELVVIDPIARKIVRSWPTTQVGYYARFADRGKAICAGDNGENLYEDKRAPPRCMGIDTGSEISEAFAVNGGAPLFAAEHGNRVIVSDHSHVWNVFYREYDTALTKRVVLNFEENTVVGSWRPDTQSYTLLGPKLFKDAFACAISPDGEYVAEGGGRILRLYKIEP